jgi:hypothetical protein
MADFDKTLNSASPGEVVPTGRTADGSPTSAPLEIPVVGPDNANFLLVFTGIALVNVQFSEDDELIRRGEVRVRLNFPLPANVTFISSATTAALSSIFNGDDDEDTTFAVDEVRTQPEPVDPSNPAAGLELVLTAKLAIQGGDTGISSVSYQANVLVRNDQPDIDQVLVRPSARGGFSSSAGVETGSRWDIEVLLTGPNPGPGAFPYTVETSNAADVPIDVLDSIQQVPAGNLGAAKPMIAPVGLTPGRNATITVTGRRNKRTATILIIPNTR